MSRESGCFCSTALMVPQVTTKSLLFTLALIRLDYLPLDVRDLHRAAVRSTDLVTLSVPLWLAAAQYELKQRVAVVASALDRQLMVALRSLLLDDCLLQSTVCGASPCLELRSIYSILPRVVERYREVGVVLLPLPHHRARYARELRADPVVAELAEHLEVHGLPLVERELPRYCLANGVLRAHVLQHYAEAGEDRKSTRLNSSHVKISYAVFCLKKKNKR